MVDTLDEAQGEVVVLRAFQPFAGDAFEGAEAPVYRIAEMVFPSAEALHEAEQSEEWAATRADAGGMIERFGVTLDVAMGDEVIGEIPARS